MKCNTCPTDVNPHENTMIILPDALWLSIAKKEELLCVECIEKRLGRKITLEDFPEEEVSIYGGQMTKTREVVANARFLGAVGLTEPLTREREFELFTNVMKRNYDTINKRG